MPRIYNRPTPAADSPDVAVLDQEHQPVAVHRDPPAPRPKAQPATPPPVKPTRQARDVSEILQRRAAESAALLEAAEEVLNAQIDGQTLNSDERSLLVALGFTGEKLAAETRRLTRVRGWQTRAGTQAEREQDSRTADQAKEERDRRGPEIEQQIADLQRELATLDTTAAQARAAIENREAAVKALRDRELLPATVQAELDDAAKAMTPIKARVNTLKQEIETTARLAPLQVTDRAVIDFARFRKLPCYVERADQPSSLVQTVDPTGWRQYIAQRQADDEQRQAEIEVLQAELEPLNAKRESLLSFYVR